MLVEFQQLCWWNYIRNFAVKFGGVVVDISTDVVSGNSASFIVQFGGNLGGNFGGKFGGNLFGPVQIHLGDFVKIGMTLSESQRHLL